MSPTLTPILVAVLASLAAGALAYVLLFRRISEETTVGRRIERVQGAPRAREARRGNDLQMRRARVQEALKEIDDKARRPSRKLTLKMRMQQAGLSWSMRQFVLISVACGLVAFAGMLVGSGQLIFAAGAGFVGGLGLPRWLVNFLRKRRQSAFVNEFANAVDVIVRGVKAGLPLNDCLRVIAQESQEPVRSEFRQIVEAQTLGIPTSEAVERLFERMPVAEANFFGIVIAIQQKTGGNLSEALGNLSKVLRDRKKMKNKIQAMSTEAKASAAIIGALPLVTMSLVYLTTPDYIALLWTEKVGHIMLAGSALWMLCGVLVMRKMINFDF